MAGLAAATYSIYINIMETKRKDEVFRITRSGVPPRHIATAVAMMMKAIIATSVK